MIIFCLKMGEPNDFQRIPLGPLVPRRENGPAFCDFGMAYGL